LSSGSKPSGDGLAVAGIDPVVAAETATKVQTC